MPTPRLSIAVATFNRAEILGECLESFARQSVPSELYEVIAVDNNSTDSTLVVAEEMAARYPNFRVVNEANQGASHARNRGYREARAAWVAYVDDDVRAFPNFVQRALQTIDQFGFDCFGGVYLPWYKYGRPKWYRDDWASNKAGKVKTVGVMQESFADGGVIVFRKEALEKVNGFSADLGPKGDQFAYGEETHLQVVLRQRGYIIGFDPNLIVEHLVAQKKLSVRWFLTSSYLMGRAHWDAFEIVPTWWKLFKLSLRIPRKLCKHSILSAIKMLKNEYYFQNAFLDTLRPCAFRLGQIHSGVERMRERRGQNGATSATATATPNERDTELKADRWAA